MGDRLYAGWAAGDGTDGAGAGGAGRPDGASVAAAYAAGMWAGDPAAAAAAAAAAAVAVGPPLAGPDAALHGLPPPGAAQPASYTVQLPPRRPTDAAMASPDHGAGYEHLRYAPGLAYAPPRPRPPSHAPLHRQHPHHVQHSAFSYAHPPNAFMPPDHHPPHSSQHHQHLPQYYPTQGPAEYHTHTLQPQPQQPPPPEYPARQTQSTPARLAMPSQFNPQQPLPAAPSRGPHERSSDFGAYPHACHDALGPPAAMRRQWSDDALAPQLPPAKMAAVPPAHAVYAHGGGGAAAGTWYGAGAELRSTYAADEPPNDEPGPPARPSSAPSHPHELAPDAVTSRSAPPGAARRLDLDLSVETYAMNRSLPPAQLPDDVANSLRAAFRDHVATPNGGAHTFLNEVLRVLDITILLPLATGTITHFEQVLCKTRTGKVRRKNSERLASTKEVRAVVRKPKRRPSRAADDDGADDVTGTSVASGDEDESADVTDTHDDDESDQTGGVSDGERAAGRHRGGI